MMLLDLNYGFQINKNRNKNKNRKKNKMENKNKINNKIKMKLRKISENLFIFYITFLLFKYNFIIHNF